MRRWLQSTVADRAANSSTKEDSEESKVLVKKEWNVGLWVAIAFLGMGVGACLVWLSIYTNTYTPSIVGNLLPCNTNPPLPDPTLYGTFCITQTGGGKIYYNNPPPNFVFSSSLLSEIHQRVAKSIGPMATGWQLYQLGTDIDGDVTGTTISTTVEFVGGKSASQVAFAVDMAFAINATNTTHPDTSANNIFFPYSTPTTARITILSPGSLQVDDGSGGAAIFNVQGQLLQNNRPVLQSTGNIVQNTLSYWNDTSGLFVGASGITLINGLTGLSMTGPLVADAGTFVNSVSAPNGNFSILLTAQDLDVYNQIMTHTLVATGSVTTPVVVATNGSFSNLVSADSFSGNSATIAGLTTTGSLVVQTNILAQTLNVTGLGTFGTGLFLGGLSAASGSFSGGLAAASGTFSGNVTADGITANSFTVNTVIVTNLNVDTLTGRTATFSGLINADTIALSNQMLAYSAQVSTILTAVTLNATTATLTNIVSTQISTQTLTASGQIQANTLVVTNGVQAASATLSANLTADYITALHDVSAQNLYFTHNVSGLNGFFTGQLFTSSLVSAGGLAGASLVVSGTSQTTTLDVTGSAIIGNTLTVSLVNVTTSLTATSATVLNGLTASSGSFQTSVSAASGSFTGPVTVNGVARGDLFAPQTTVVQVGNIPYFTGSKQVEASYAVLSQNGALSNLTGLVLTGTITVTGDILLDGVSLHNALSNGTVYGPPTGSQDRAFAIFTGTTGLQLASGPGALSLAGDVTGWNSVTVTSFFKVNSQYVPVSPASTNTTRMILFGDTLGQTLVQSTATLTTTGDMTVNTLLINNRLVPYGPASATDFGRVVLWNSAAGTELGQATSVYITTNNTMFGISNLYVGQEIFIGGRPLSTIIFTNGTVGSVNSSTPNAIATWVDPYGRILQSTNTQLTTAGDLTVNTLATTASAVIGTTLLANTHVATPTLTSPSGNLVISPVSGTTTFASGTLSSISQLYVSDASNTAGTVLHLGVSGSAVATNTPVAMDLGPGAVSASSGSSASVLKLKVASDTVSGKQIGFGAVLALDGINYSLMYMSNGQHVFRQASTGFTGVVGRLDSTGFGVPTEFYSDTNDLTLKSATLATRFFYSANFGVGGTEMVQFNSTYAAFSMPITSYTGSLTITSANLITTFNNNNLTTINYIFANGLYTPLVTTSSGALTLSSASGAVTTPGSFTANTLIASVSTSTPAIITASGDLSVNAASTNVNLNNNNLLNVNNINTVTINGVTYTQVCNQEFSTPSVSAQNYTIPSTTQFVIVDMTGGGGGGAGAASGGAAGTLLNYMFPVAFNYIFNYFVGTGGTYNVVGLGTDSYFNYYGTLSTAKSAKAQGGQGGNGGGVYVDGVLVAQGGAYGDCNVGSPGWGEVWNNVAFGGGGGYGDCGGTTVLSGGCFSITPTTYKSGGCSCLGVGASAISVAGYGGGGSGSTTGSRNAGNGIIRLKCYSR